MLIVSLVVAHWFLAVFIQSGFHHRYASHRMFTMPKVTERAVHLLAWLVQGPSYLPPRAYAILHREHHAYSDTARDPHAPAFAGNVFAMMWATAKRFSAHVDGRSTPEARFLCPAPEWSIVDRIGSSWMTRVALGTSWGLLYLWLATAWWQFLLLPLHWMMGPVQGAIVNWCGHRYGYRNFATRDDSRNTLPIDFVTMGELFQNNHHRAAGRLNFAWRRFEVDPTYQLLRVLAWMGVIRIESGDDAASLAA
jgi:stearoyl-CoA desaturase (delta-9 desaturase)